jgi:multicomponent Na+:H+ antiporter subunit E
MRVLSLLTILLFFWLALSGHYTPFLIAAGITSSIGCVVAARRMGCADAEGHPLHLFGRTVSYFPWLLWQICKSAWSVTKIILDPRLPVSPTLTRVLASQRTSVGVATYANSITLTPGTITVGVKDNILTVHALVRDGAIDLEEGGMDARVSAFEGRI